MHRTATCLFLLLLWPVLTLSAQQGPAPIRLNQVGFYPEGPKAAVVSGAASDRFFVTTPDLADTLFAGTLGPARRWPPSEETVRLADFSALRAEGSFVVVVPGLPASSVFDVRPDVHGRVAADALKAFYYQRASTPLPAEYAGIWSRPAGHPETNVQVHPSAAGPGRPAGTVLAAPKGWYDAGDYNKYIVNSGITTYTLLAVHEHYPSYAAGLAVNIPEGGDAVPDVLDEALWNVRWMLTMQDPADGGVYHKLTDPSFDGFVMPHEVTQQRYVVQKTTAAALDFAAVMAQVGRLLAPYEDRYPGLADSARTAALDAWRWARRMPEVYYEQGDLNARFDPDVVTGTYGDRNVSDEFRWAAAELFATTRADSFLAHVGPIENPASVPAWSDVGTLGLMTLAHHRAALPAETARAVEAALVARADALVADADTSAYGVPMGARRSDFVWGSNAVAANQGMVLLRAYALTGRAAYLDAARANLDYLLGRNATGYSFVTGHGDRTPMHPHHRPSEADGVALPVPGFLAGGPNPGQQDRGDCPEGIYSSGLPATSYVDHVCSYAANEIAINWNAPLVYLAAGVEALQPGTTGGASSH